MKPFTFSDGITVPKNSLLGIPVSAIHRDESVYENANEFDGFRFWKLREKNGDQPKYHCVNTNADFLTFGLGNHNW